MALKRFARKFLALTYDFFMFPIEKLTLQKLRKKISRLVTGKYILELGVGTGLNIPAYPNEIKVIAIEPRFEMIERARKRAGKFNKNISFICARAEALPFKRETFDTVFATFVFCEVGNPEKGFSEILRVLKSTGNMILLEHVRPDGKSMAKIFDIANIFTSTFGENINRKTIEIAVKSGITIKRVENIYDGIVKLIIGVK